jgi:phosphoglycerol transferase MdoB-like AlkP superfamily enzyme
MNHFHKSTTNTFPGEYHKSSPRLFFFSYISFVFLLILIGFLSLLDFGTKQITPTRFFGIFAILDVFFIELFVLFFFGWFLLRKSIYSRIILYVLSSSFIVIYSAQLTSFYIANEYISKLALDNINHIHLLLDPLSSAISLGLLLTCFALPFIIEKKLLRQRPDPKRHSPAVYVFLLFLFAFSTNNHWLPQAICDQKEDLHNNNSLQRSAPITALFKTIFQKELFSKNGETNIQFSQYEIQALEGLGFHYNPESKYPLIKDTIYSSPVPFQKLPGQLRAPNIIVFFTEGYSARGINAYGSIYSNITPHLKDFASNSMVVDNYYNHTSATYRGLHGQLCSLYPTYGGTGGWQTNYSDLPKTDYRCLPDIFNEKRYDTIFLDAHLKDKSQVDEMVLQFGFKDVITGEELLNRFLNKSTAMRKESISDKQFYQGLIGYLKERDSKERRDMPFFMGLYNLGTHAFLRIPKDGIKYKKGKNRSLNKIHTLDMAFNQFWQYYQKSPYAKNTIIIFTADHCNYPEKPFVKAFEGDDYQPLFVDKIPLIIHDPTRHLPQRFDARNSTSIAFAPSLLHYLGWDNARNPFIGISIFEDHPSQKIDLGVSSAGENLFIISNEQIHYKKRSEQYPILFQIINKYIRVSQYLEINNRLWDKNTIVDSTKN